MQICLPKILSNHGFTPSQCPYHQLIFNYLRVNIRKINRVIFLIEKILEEKSCKPCNNMPPAELSQAQLNTAEPSPAKSVPAEHITHPISAQPSPTEPSPAESSPASNPARPSPAQPGLVKPSPAESSPTQPRWTQTRRG